MPISFWIIEWRFQGIIIVIHDPLSQLPVYWLKLHGIRLLGLEVMKLRRTERVKLNMDNFYYLIVSFMGMRNEFRRERLKGSL